jgi:hypothetical protein
LELQKAKSEILSYEKIVKVLQEELCNKDYLSKIEVSEQKDYSGDLFKDQPRKDDWVQVATKSYRINSNSNRNLIQIIPTIHNRYELLSNLKDDESTNNSIKDVEVLKLSNNLQTRRMNQLVNSVVKGKHSVLVIGDSHANKYMAKLRNNLYPRYEVSRFIKPGATTSEIIKTTEDEIATLKYNDIVILWEGANDVNTNNTKEALRNLSKFMNANKVNIVLVSLPLRYDLLPSSCVNKEIIKFNRQLKKIVKLHINVVLLEVELKRKHYTRHGVQSEREFF